MRRTIAIRGLLVLAGALPFISWSLSRFTLDGGRLLAPWFRMQCHNLQDRTLVLGGRYFPVCSRCLGIYGGLFLAGLIGKPSLTHRSRRVWLFGAALLMVLEVFVQDRTGHRPYHSLRLMTGILLAWPVALTLIAATQPEAPR